MELLPLLSDLCIDLLGVGDSSAQQTSPDLHEIAIAFMTWVIVVETLFIFTLYTVQRIVFITKDILGTIFGKRPKPSNRKNQKPRGHTLRNGSPDEEQTAQDQPSVPSHCLLWACTIMPGPGSISTANQKLYSCLLIDEAILPFL